MMAKQSKQILAMRSGLGVAAIVGFIGLTVTPVQGAPTDQAATAPSLTQTSDDIVVTARKRSERVQDVPSAISVISSSQLEVGSPRDLKDLVRDVPGLSFSGGEFGQSSYTIRGISTTSINPTTGVYLDDISLVTLGSNFTGAVDLVPFDLNRVEVLKGPQGTLYGGSSMGGAIKYVSQAPSLSKQTLDLAATGSVTSSGSPSYDVQGVVNVPLIENRLALRAGLLYRSDGGYIDNIAGGNYENYAQSSTNPPESFAPTAEPSLSSRSVKDQNSDTVFGARLSALWQPDDSWEITPSVVYQRYREKNPSIYWTNLPKFESAFREAQPTNDDLVVADLAVVKHLGGADVTSLTGYFDRKVLQDRDYSFYVGALIPAIYDLNGQSTSNTSTSTVSEELRIASSVKNSRLHWIFGLYYSHQVDKFQQIVDEFGVGGLLGTGTDAVYTGLINTSTDQYAAFGNLTFSILKNLDVGVGVRLFDIERSTVRAADGLFNGGPSQSAGTSSEKGVNPKAEIDYRATRDNLLYASAAKGFRPGGENATIAAGLCGPDLQALGLKSVPDSYQSDSLWTYELGSKNEFLGHRLKLNAAAYYTDWSKIQQGIFLSSCGLGYTSNVGAATVKGGEIGGQYELFRGFVAGGNFNYADARITRTSPGVSAQVGQPVLGTPKWMVNAYLGYTFPVGDGTLSARADYQYHGSQLNDFSLSYVAQNLDGYSVSVPNFNRYLKSYSVINLGFTLTMGHMDYGVFVNNLGNVSPVIAYAPINEFIEGETIRPRTIGAHVRAHF